MAIRSFDQDFGIGRFDGVFEAESRKVFGPAVEGADEEGELLWFVQCSIGGRD